MAADGHGVNHFVFYNSILHAFGCGSRCILSAVVVPRSQSRVTDTLCVHTFHVLLSHYTRLIGETFGQ